MNISGYEYGNAECTHAHQFLVPVLLNILDREVGPGKPCRIFELGCGNGAVANLLSERGFVITGVDPSEKGIAWANKRYPNLSLFEGSTADDLVARFGRFPILISLEVVEHVYAPREFASKAYDLVEPGGSAVISTPYHGYLKNLVIAATGKMDKHFTALWDHGHIKFWSIRTLSTLLKEAGFVSLDFHRVGRIPALARSMIVVAKKQ